MQKELWKGNEAIAEAAIRAGCRYFFGYPITPQNEIPEYMSAHLPKVGGCFVQSESEVSAINMVYGAASAGARVMTSSSSPGISLKQEGIAYCVGSELPCVIVNVMRGGPGLGTIQSSQADYFQATRGGGNGDYRTLTLAPKNIQEAADLTMLAFDLADKYCNPVMILADGLIGQMMEDMEWHEPPKTELPPKDWALTGRHGRAHHNEVKSWRDTVGEMEALNHKLQRKYDQMTAEETRYEAIGCDGADFIFVAYGTMARLCEKAAQVLAGEGYKIGVFRPITLWPFPAEAIAKACCQPSVKGVFVVEQSMGQMIEDVKMSTGLKEVGFYGRPGGVIPTAEDVIEAARNYVKGVK